MVVLFVNDWLIEERLICFELLAKSLSGEEIARQLISVLSVKLSISSVSSSLVLRLSR